MIIWRNSGQKLYQLRPLVLRSLANKTFHQKVAELLLKIKLAASRTNCVLNFGFILCLYLETKYCIAVSSNSYGILVYKLHISKVIKSVTSVTFRLYIFLRILYYLLCRFDVLVKRFRIRSKKLLNILEGHFDPPTTGFSFESLSSEMVISSLFC